MDKVKKSWDYQKGKYKQINIKFNMDSHADMQIYDFLRDHNATDLIKNYVRGIIDPCYMCMGAANNDCERCQNHGKVI